MKVCCISDLHGNLISIPKCDLLLVAGDIVPLDIQRDIEKSLDWFYGVFLPWKKYIESQGSRVISIFGNHDFMGERGDNNFAEEGFLKDESVMFRGLKIYGTPYQKKYGYDWAFNLEDDSLTEKYNLIPTDTDILLMHAPPYGMLDYVDTVVGGIEKREHCGCNLLRAKLDELNLKLFVSGHIHFSAGAEYFNEVLHVNASICNEDYLPANRPIVVEIK